MLRLRMGVLKTVHLASSKVKNKTPEYKIRRVLINVPSTQRICLIFAMVYINISNQGNYASISMETTDYEDKINLTNFATTSRTNSLEEIPSDFLTLSNNVTVSALYGTSRLNYRVSNSSSLQSMNLSYIRKAVVGDLEEDKYEGSGNERESTVPFETTKPDFSIPQMTLTLQPNNNAENFKDKGKSLLNMIKGNLTTNSSSGIVNDTSSTEVPSTSLETAFSDIHASDFDLTTEGNNATETDAIPIRNIDTREMVTASTNNIPKKHNFTGESTQSTFPSFERQQPSQRSHDTSNANDRENITYGNAFLSSNDERSATTQDKMTTRIPKLLSTSDTAHQYILFTTTIQNNTSKIFTNSEVAEMQSNYLSNEVSKTRNGSQLDVSSTTLVTHIPYSQSSTMQPKHFFFRHVNNLTNAQKSNIVIGIVFISQIDIVEWFHTYDHCFRNTIASLISQTKEDKQISDAKDIIYIAPTPTKNEKYFCVSFIVQTPLSGDLYEHGEIVASVIKKNISKFSKNIALPVVMVMVGYNVTDKCNFRSSSNESNWFVNCLAISIVIVAIGGIFATCLQKVKQQRSIEFQREPKTQVWGSNRRHRSGHYGSAHPLGTTVQETTASSTSETESPNRNCKTNNYELGIENALIHYHENHDVTEDTKL